MQPSFLSMNDPLVLKCFKDEIPTHHRYWLRNLLFVPLRWSEEGNVFNTQKSKSVSDDSQPSNPSFKDIPVKNLKPDPHGVTSKRTYAALASKTNKCVCLGYRDKCTNVIVIFLLLSTCWNEQTIRFMIDLGEDNHNVSAVLENHPKTSFDIEVINIRLSGNTLL